MSSRWKHARFSSAICCATIVAIAVGWQVTRPPRAGAAAVEVRGNRVFTDEQLENLAPANPWKNPETVARRIQSAYIGKGHLLAAIRIEMRGSDSTVVCHIEEGAPTVLGTVRLRGVEGSHETQVRKILDARTGDRYVPTNLRDGFRRVLEHYDASGYPFTQIWVDSISLDQASNTVDLSVYVVEGGRETVSRVEFEGLEHTREDRAVRLSGLKIGEPYDGERIRESFLRLTTSGVFDEVSYPAVRMSADGSGVEAVIRVLETKGRNSVSGAIGYADREGAEDRVLSGLFRLDVANIGGSLRDLNILWKNDGQGRSETQLSFRDRFFLGRRVGLGLKLEQIGLDTLYTWQSLGVESSVPVGRFWNGLVGVDLGLYGDRNTFSQGDVSNTLRFRVAAGVSFVDGREDRGAFLDLRTRHTYGKKKVRGRTEERKDQAVSQYVFESQIRVVADIARNVHGGVALVYRGIETSEESVPLSEQFYVGGAATIRGYRENQFHARRIAYARSELRLGKNRRENGYVFVDGGYVARESSGSSGDVAREEEFPVGYGFGLRTESRLGNIDISFGVGDELSLRQTKVHVILNRTF